MNDIENPRRGRLSSVCFLLALAVAQLLPAQAAETNTLLARWLGAQSEMKSWSADFIQTRTLKSLANPLIAHGHLSFAAPNQFRWEITNPAPTIALRATNELFVIYPRLKRAERYPLTGDQAGPWRDTLALLEAGFPRSQSDLESRFRITSQSVTNGTCELALQPRAASARRMMPQIRIAFSTNTFSLLATELHFADGSIMRNDFTNSVMNPSLADSVFAPAIPADFRITEPARGGR
jgi:outer membrane lipoprotein-sorting protein